MGTKEKTMTKRGMTPEFIDWALAEAHRMALPRMKYNSDRDTQDVMGDNTNYSVEFKGALGEIIIAIYAIYIGWKDMWELNPLPTGPDFVINNYRIDVKTGIGDSLLINTEQKPYDVYIAVHFVQSACEGRGWGYVKGWITFKDKTNKKIAERTRNKNDTGYNYNIPYHKLRKMETLYNYINLNK